MELVTAEVRVVLGRPALAADQPAVTAAHSRRRPIVTAAVIVRRQRCRRAIPIYVAPRALPVSRRAPRMPIAPTSSPVSRRIIGAGRNYPMDRVARLIPTATAISVRPRAFAATPRAPAHVRAVCYREKPGLAAISPPTELRATVRLARQEATFVATPGSATAMELVNLQARV